MVNIDDAPAPLDHVRSGSGPSALLFVHGFLDGAAVWDGVETALAELELEKITLDLPGMGALASADGPISLRRYAADVGSVLEAVHKPVVIVGQSMGAQVAELAAVAHPDRVAGLVLLTPVPLGGVKAPSDVIEPFRRLGGEPEAQRKTRAELSVSLLARDLERLGALGDLVAPATVAALVEAWNEGDPSGATPSQFAGPVLVIRGAGDPFVSDAMADAIASRFSNVRQATVKNAGHWAHVEQPWAVADLLAGFVGEISWAPAMADRASEEAAGDWRSAFANKSAAQFDDAFADDVVLEASVLNFPVAGRENVKTVLAAASKLYEKLDFTNRAAEGSRQYLEWTAQAFDGVQFGGITILTRDDAGAIKHIAIHHRPLQALLQFSSRLGEALDGEIDAKHFFQSFQPSARG